jgi:hypothetical protein
MNELNRTWQDFIAYLGAAFSAVAGFLAQQHVATLIGMACAIFTAASAASHRRMQRALDEKLSAARLETEKLRQALLSAQRAGLERRVLSESVPVSSEGIGDVT